MLTVIGEAIVSRPVRARGLKPWLLTGYLVWLLSRPVRARGLKPSWAQGLTPAKVVAPRAGAWIETHPRAS